MDISMGHVRTPYIPFFFFFFFFFIIYHERKAGYGRNRAQYRYEAFNPYQI